MNTFFKKNSDEKKLLSSFLDGELIVHIHNENEYIAFMESLYTDAHLDVPEFPRNKAYYDPKYPYFFMEDPEAQYLNANTSIQNIQHYNPPYKNVIDAQIFLSKKDYKHNTGVNEKNKDFLKENNAYIIASIEEKGAHIGRIKGLSFDADNNLIIEADIDSQSCTDESFFQQNKDTEYER